MRSPSHDKASTLSAAIRHSYTPSEVNHGHEDQPTGLTLGEDSTSGVNNVNSRYNSALETREELIIRVKREQRLRWLENPGNINVEDLSPSLGTATNSKTDRLSLSPVHDIKLRISQVERTSGEHIESPANIVRPRSALHAGDFRELSPGQEAFKAPVGSPCAFPNPRDSWLSASPTTPWYTPYNPHFSRTNVLDTQHEVVDTLQPSHSKSGPRAASYSSLSSSFVFRPPTSPLAQQSNSNDLETLEVSSSRYRYGSPERSSRRHTYSPRTSRHLHISGTSASAHDQQVPPFRREGIFPYQAHQPRRSLESFSQLQSLPVPQISSARSRRISLTSDASSSLQHAPMIGRYEESILRGRMSTLPSRPFDFVAQIGVLGNGNCKSNLRCPPHITIPFPAVFYNYGTPRGNITSLNERPSPYVGLVDLENVEKKLEAPGSGRVARPSTASTGNESNRDEPKKSNVDDVPVHSGQMRPKRNSKRPMFLKPPPKGSYRIPQQGQLQIVIKNPNKTAVKLYLVPYDLAGMEAGQKTFIRQRSYSAGPVIDMPLSLRKNLGTDRPEAALTNSDDPTDRPVLRYLIHLNICCPSRGRYYLYKSIRVVFANRVPDGMEKLRNEIQLPDPLYSVYKPDKSSVGRNNTISPLPYQMDGERHGSYGSDVLSAGIDRSYARRDCEEAQKHQTWDSFQLNHHSDLQDSRSQPDTFTPAMRSTGIIGDRMTLDSPSAYNSATIPSRSSLSWKYLEQFHEATSLKPNMYTKMSKEDYSKSEIRSGAQSPRAGAGLITSQLRNLVGKQSQK